jgi:hypothetical protein
MNHIGWVLLGQVEFIPLSGKIALLSSLFSYFDFYVLAGGGVVNLAAKDPMPGACAARNALVPGLHHDRVDGERRRWCPRLPQPLAGLNLEFRDLIYKNNASGRDVNGDTFTDTHDLEWSNNWIFSLNIQFFVPFKAKISR